MLGEVCGKLVEIVGQLDLSAKRPKGLRDGSAALHATSRAAGRPERWMTTSSPPSARATSRDN